MIDLSALQKRFSTEKAILLLIIFLAFVLRLYRIDYPLADWHSFRQSDTASVTREYVKHGIDLLHPRYHDLSNIQSGERTGGQDNVEGWRMVEFPFVNAGIAWVLRKFPELTLVETSRLFSILASLGTLTSVYLLVKEYSGKKVAMVAAFLFATLPYAIFYSRVILPEPYMLLFSTFSILTFGYWAKGKSEVWLLLSAICLALALLLKPFVLFLAPIFVIVALQPLLSIVSNKPKPFTWLTLGTKIVIFSAISLLPLYFWRHWIQQYPAGIPASDWLFNSNGIRFRPAWFRWLFYERLTKLILGYVGVMFIPLAFLNTLKTPNLQFQSVKKYLIHNTQYLILPAWWLGILLYFSVIATGNVQHDYYQVVAIPVVCWTVAEGIIHLYKFLKKFSPEGSLAVVGILYTTLLFFSWQQVKGYFNVNNWEYIEAGQAVDRLTPPDAKVIAPAFGDTVFLFQTNRTGWPIGFDINQKISEGAQYYVSTSYDDEARELEKKYQVVEKTEKYILIDLTKKKE